MRWSVLFLLPALTACAAEMPAPEQETDTPSAPVVLDMPELTACVAPDKGGEPIAVACEELSVCESACSGAVITGCAALAIACGFAEVITIGAVTIPCSVALPAACAGGTAGIFACISAVCR
ncbi:MAG: hypothetical protein QM820_43150 [Minicystis sp.]